MPPNQRRSAGARRMGVHQYRPAFIASRSVPIAAARFGERAQSTSASAGKDAAALGDQATCRSPASSTAADRTGACARPSLFSGSGVGVNEYVAVVKGCNQLQAPCESSMPLPNTSPDMSPTPTTLIGWRLDVDVNLAEMALHRLPGAARGDAHFLVIVARPSRRTRRRRPSQMGCTSFKRIALADVGDVAVPLSAATTR